MGRLRAVHVCGIQLSWRIVCMRCRLICFVAGMLCCVFEVEAKCRLRRVVYGLLGERSVMMKATRALVFAVLGPRRLVPEAAADWWIMVVDVRLQVRVVSLILNCYLRALEVRQRIVELTGLSVGIGSILAHLSRDFFEVKSWRMRRLLICKLIY